MDLNSAKIFVHVSSQGSFSKAARYLGVPVATVSRKVKELEEQVGFALIERSTRNLRLTEPGSILYEYASKGLEEMEAGLLALTDQQKELKGTLRFSFPPNFEPIWKLIADFQEIYRKISIEVMVSERRIDFIEDGIDLSLRIGNIDSLSAVARRLHTYRHQLVASKKYFRKRAHIESPSGLHLHSCAMWGNQRSKKVWKFEGTDIEIEPRIISNDYSFIHHLIETGNYIAEVPPFLCEKEIKTGKFIKVLDKYKFEQQDLNLVYPSGRRVSRITRVFIDYCIQNFDKLFKSHKE